MRALGVLSVGLAPFVFLLGVGFSGVPGVPLLTTWTVLWVAVGMIPFGIHLVGLGMLIAAVREQQPERLRKRPANEEWRDV